MTELSLSSRWIDPAVLNLQFFGHGSGQAKSAGNVGGDHLAADVYDGDMPAGLLEKDRNVGGAAAYIDQHDSVAALLWGEARLGRGERLEDAAFESDSGDIDALFEITHRIGRAG